MADVSSPTVTSSSNGDPQIVPEKQNDGLESTNEAGIAVNGGKVKEEEDVFSDAPEAPIGDQNGFLAADDGAAFVAGGEGGDELTKSVESEKDLDGEFRPVESIEVSIDGKDRILGDEESGSVENSSAVVGDSEKDEKKSDDYSNVENIVKDNPGVNEVSLDVGDSEDSVTVKENENFSVGDGKAETLDAGIGADSSSVSDQDKFEKLEGVMASVKEGGVNMKKVDDGFVVGEVKENVSSDGGPYEESLVDSTKETVTMVEKFEDVATSVNEDSVDTKNAENKSVIGEVKEDVTTDVGPDEEGLLQEEAYVSATKGAENKVENVEAVADDEGTRDKDKAEEECFISRGKEDVQSNSGPNDDSLLQEDAIINATEGGDNDEIYGEVNKDVARDNVSKEENLMWDKVGSNSFEKADAGAVDSADNDENGGEEMKEASREDVPQEESLLLEQADAAAVPEQEKADPGSSEKGFDEIAYPSELTSIDNSSVETDPTAVITESNKGVGLAELATDGVSMHDRQLTPALPDGSESKEPNCLPPSSVQASASITETEPKNADGVSTSVGEDHTLQGNEVEGEVLNTLGVAQELEDDYSNSSPYSQLDSSKDIDGQIASDSDVEVETDEETSDREIIDADTLTALLKAASSSAQDGSLNVTSQDGNRIFTFDRPAGLGSSIPSLRPAPHRSVRSMLSASETAMTAVPDNDMTEEEKILHDKVELIKVKFLRLVQRLGHSPEDTVAAQVLYRLSLAEGIRHGRQTNRAFGLENAKKKALQLETDGKEALDFSCNILVVGKSGVGKSATINSIFGGEKSHTDAFAPATNSVKEITGIVDGVKVRVIDTPGLRMSMMDQKSNRKVLLDIKKYTKKCPPDIVLYVDRMDSQTRDLNDLPLLKSIANTLGPSIWFNAIVALTHAASAPPDGPSGAPLSYEVYVAQRSHIIQQSIRLAAGDMRLMNPVALVENHQSCRKNRDGQKVLPNGLAWRQQMLLLCYSSKILSEANSLLKLQDPSPKKLFNRFRSPPLPFLLSSLLQSKTHPKLTPEQGGEAVDSDVDLDDLSDSDQENEEDEYDQLPPFKPLSKAQIAKLTKEQRKAYLDEFDYRVKLLQKKQWKDELKRMRDMKKGGKKVQDDFGYGGMAEENEQDSAPATVPVPLPDMVLPPSFDCEAPTYRYRFLEPTSQLLARPVLDTHGWDHDCGYDGVSLEESLAIASRFPAVISAQVTKDKKEFSIHLESSVSAKHGDNGSSLAGFNVQAVGKQLAYTLLGESKFKNFRKNRTAGGFSVTFLGETVATGLKFEDQLSIGKRVTLVSSAGTVRSQNDTAYGANLEARLQDKEYPIGQTLTTLGLSLMKWHRDLALGANFQSQFSVGRNSKMSVRVGLNNKLTGQITVKTSSSEQLQLALVGIIPVALSIYRNIMSGMD